jgi:periplasmic copper chaperone A
MKRLFLTVAILASLAAFAKGQQLGDLMIVNASAPPSLVPTATSASVYFTIINQGTVDDELVSVSTPVGMAMMHETVIESDVATMLHLQSIAIPPGQTVDLKQGGKHVMLAGLEAPLKEGDVLPLELTFARAGSIKLNVVVAKQKPAN